MLAAHHGKGTFGLWVIGALIALAGAFSYSELGASLPQAGGDYVYLRQAYGPLVRTTVVPASGGNTELQLQLLEDLGASGLCCTPSFALLLAERAGDRRIDLRYGVFGAEPWSEALRTQLEEAWGIDACDIYGLSEVMGPGVAAECREGKGALMVPARPSVLFKMLTPRRYVDREHAQRVAGDVYGGVFRRQPALVDRTFRHVRFASRRGYYLQLAATFGWTSLPWLPALRQPTLIMTGADDPIVPAINARLMQWLIPDARLVTLACGHLFLVTLARESARIVDAFLTESNERGRPAPPPTSWSLQ